MGLNIKLLLNRLQKGKENNMVQKGHKLGTMSGGSYDKQAHAGKGKDQKLLFPAVGASPNRPTPHATKAVVRDAVQGEGGPKRGYQMDAHSGLYHGKRGEAVGHKQDNRPMDYNSSLYSEGRPLSPDGDGPTFVPNHAHGTKGSKATAHPLGHSTKAAHHPPAPKGAHEFTKLPAGGGHGYGHAPAQQSGWLRLSGHANAHQIGKK